MHSHSREAALTQLWWIQGATSATLTVVGVDKITTKGPLQWGFNGWTFYLITQFFELTRITMATILSVYMSKKTRCSFLKKLKPPSLSIKGHV
jgi:hypothetical protein